MKAIIILLFLLSLNCSGFCNSKPSPLYECTHQINNDKYIETIQKYRCETRSDDGTTEIWNYVPNYHLKYSCNMCSVELVNSKLYTPNKQ